MSLAIINARVLTLTGGEPPVVLPRASVLVEGERLALVAEGDAGAERVLAACPSADHTIDARGRVLLPGFVDCHTHACWAGDRLDEWELKLRGASYLDILASGGGIMSTVRAVRAASQEQLTRTLLTRLNLMLACGSTTIEVKSGYGLTPEHELKMLRAVRDAAASFDGTLVPTALLGHALDAASVPPPFPQTPDGYADWTIDQTLPAVSAEFPGVAVDAFCEQGAWSLAQCLRLFNAAKRRGHPVRVHADQFNALGMVEAAARIGAVSVDHLEASGPAQIAALAAAERTSGVILPVCGLHVDGRYAPGRALVDALGPERLCIATNFNPGSAPCPSIPTVIALAVRFCGLTPHEAIVAATRNPARMLGFTDRGTIAPGQRADLLLLRHTDERSLAYELGDNPVDAVVCGGRVVARSAADGWPE